MPSCETAFSLIVRLGISQTKPGPSGPVQALRGVDPKLGSGEVFGGASCGGTYKSSLVRMINLLNRPTAGRMLVGFCVA